MKKKILLIYAIVFFIVLCVPCVGMLWHETTTTKEKKDLASFPSLTTKNGGFNEKLFDQFNDYLSDHFAYKQELVTANALIRSKIFKESTEPQVIEGKDDYLFYQEGVENYLGYDVLTDREVFNITRTLQLIQKYCESKNIKFVFTIAPNKASIYSKYLPSNYSKIITTNNSLNKLAKSLKNNNVNYVDLLSTFKSEKEVLYHKLDSHWNNKGAALANNTILDYLKKSHNDYSNSSYTVRNDYDGDLYDMVFPSGNTKDKQIYYDDEVNYSIKSDNKSFEDNFVETTNNTKNGSVFVFRDSFGNSWGNFVAQEYNKAYFSRESGYNMNYLDDYKCDTLIIEITERHLSTIQNTIPFMYAPTVYSRLTPAKVKTKTTMETLDYGDSVYVSGMLDKDYTDTDSNVYVKINNGSSSFMVEATPCTYTNKNSESIYGYGAYIDKSQFTSDVSFEVITKSNNGYLSTGVIGTFK